MKIRESGMPNAQQWNSYFNVDSILKELEISTNIERIVEIGAGYGTFTIPVANKIDGLVHTYEIEPNLHLNLKRKCQNMHIENVRCYNCDVIEQGTGLQNNTVDYVMLFNILHNKKPEVMLLEAKRILKPHGKIGILHWRTDIETPRGPSLGVRSKPNDIVGWIRKIGLHIKKEPFIIEPYHFGILVEKT